MSRTIALLSLSLLCATPFALLGSTYFLDVAQAQTAPDPTATATAAPTDTSRSTGKHRTKARRDVGCVGYHGSSHGYSRNGKCVVPKKTAG